MSKIKEHAHTSAGPIEHEMTVEHNGNESETEHCARFDAAVKKLLKLFPKI